MPETVVEGKCIRKLYTLDFGVVLYVGYYK